MMAELFFSWRPYAIYLSLSQCQSKFISTCSASRYRICLLRTIATTNQFSFSKKLVAWSNEAFQNIFPQKSDITLGAVPHASTMAYSNDDRGSVQFHIFFKNEKSNETKKIIELIKKYWRNSPQESIAILVRSRSHLKEIVQTLQMVPISFQAIDIQSLSHQMEIQDLFSLTTALFNNADQLAWLSILQSPWCGLTLKDLYIITKMAKGKTIWQVLLNFENFLDLSEDGQKRLQRVVPIFSRILSVEVAHQYLNG